MMKIRTREELNQKQREYSRSLKSQKKQILVCGGTGCVGRRFAENLRKTS